MSRGVVAGVVLALALAVPAGAGGRLPLVVGDYTYQLNGGTSHVHLVAYGGAEGISGAFTFHGTFVDVGGSVTCLRVHGADAWLAGVLESGDDVGFDGWMIRLSDHGTRDRAVTFIDDYGVAMAWCDNRSADGADLIQPVTEGWLLVR